MKNGILHSVVYTNKQAVGTYCDEELETAVIVIAHDEESAKMKANRIMVLKEMNTEDIWKIAWVDECTDLVGYLNKNSSYQRFTKDDILPELCYGKLPTTGETILIKKFETGYYPSSDPRPASVLNEKLGVTKAQEVAMFTGSIVGWHVPGADPSNYNEEGRFDNGRI